MRTRAYRRKMEALKKQGKIKAANGDFGYIPLAGYTVQRRDAVYYSPCSRCNRARYYKKHANKKIRRKIIRSDYDCNYRYGDYKKLYDLWWTID